MRAGGGGGHDGCLDVVGDERKRHTIVCWMTLQDAAAVTCAGQRPEQPAAAWSGELEQEEERGEHAGVNRDSGGKKDGAGGRAISEGDTGLGAEVAGGCHLLHCGTELAD